MFMRVKLYLQRAINPYGFICPIIRAALVQSPLLTLNRLPVP